MPCNQQTVACPTQQGDIKNQCCHDNLIKLASYIAKTCKGIEYWADFGTLLGIIREGDIIEYDTDMDFGITEDGWKKLLNLKDKINSDGFYFVPETNGGSIFYSKMNDLHADFFVFSDNGDEMKCIYDYNFPTCLSLTTPTKFIKKQRNMKLDNVTLPAPNNPKGVLEIRYGDYMRPRVFRNGRYVS